MRVLLNLRSVKNRLSIDLALQGESYARVTTHSRVANSTSHAFKEVYKVAGWHEAGTTFVPVREDILGSGRFEFVGTVAEDAIRDKYLNKSVKHMFKKGAVIPTMYVNC